MTTVSFHNHSEYSWDCQIKLAKLEQRCLERGVSVITITDHNEIAGAKRAAREFHNVRVLIGEEIETADGEIVGLFLTSKIEPGLSLGETIEEIHAQRGLAIVVHPFDRLRRHVITRDALLRHRTEFDAIEVYNSRTVFARDNEIAYAYARDHHKPMIVGNDAHTLGEVGLSLTTLPNFATSGEFIDGLARATFSTARAPLWVHALTKFDKWTSRYRTPK